MLKWFCNLKYRNVYATHTITHRRNFYAEHVFFCDMRQITTYIFTHTQQVVMMIFICFIYKYTHKEWDIYVYKSTRWEDKTLSVNLSHSEYFHDVTESNEKSSVQLPFRSICWLSTWTFCDSTVVCYWRFHTSVITTCATHL